MSKMIIQIEATEDNIRVSAHMQNPKTKKPSKEVVDPYRLLGALAWANSLVGNSMSGVKTAPTLRVVQMLDRGFAIENAKPGKGNA